MGRWRWNDAPTLLVVFVLLAACSTATPAPEEPVATPLPATVTPASPSSAGTPTETPLPPAPASSPTVAPSPTATATSVPPTPVVRRLDEVEPIATAPGIGVEGWSPDGRYLLYRQRAQANPAPGDPPGAFRVYPATGCTQIVDHDLARPHFWLSERELVYVTDQGDVAIWPVCSGDRAVATERFPELPQAFLAASPDRAWFLLRGESAYWLADDELLTVRPVAGLDYPVTDLASAAWSPDGAFVGLTFVVESRIVTVLIDAQRAEVVQTVESGIAGGLGSPGPPFWLSERRLLIPSGGDEWPLLVTVEGEIEEVGPVLFGETSQSEDFNWYAYAAVDPETGNYHVALTAAGIESRLPLVRLYHGESGEVEELPFRYLGGPTFFPADRWLILRRTVSTLDAAGRPISPFETWIRALDPPGGEPQLLVPIGYSWELGRWAPDWSRAAVPSVDGAQLVLVSIPGGVPLEVWQSDMPVFPVAWSPDGRHLAVVQRGTPQRPEDRLLLLPVEP